MTDPVPPVSAVTSVTGETASPPPPETPAPAAANGPVRVTGPYQHVFWLALLLATALTLGGASFAAGAYQADGMPDTVVRQYFAALQDGDAATALGYGAVPAGSRSLLTPGVLAAQNAMGPIEGVGVRQVHRSGDSAQVDVTYTVALPTGRDTVLDTVAVVRHGHGWRLAQSAIRVNLGPDGGSALASFAGAEVPDGDFLMFPGAVPVTYNTPNLRLQPSSSVLRFADTGALLLEATVTPAGERAIVLSLRAALSACLAGTASQQALCPVPNPYVDVPGSLRGTLTAVDTGALHLAVMSADGKVTIAGTVGVHATYQELDKNNIATAKTAAATTVAAYCFVTTPGTIGWEAS